VIAQVTRKHHESRHIRPFVLRRDLDGLAALIEEAFAQELAVTGSQIVRQMRKMAPLGPLLWAAGLFVQPFRGFVWVEAGELVGNVTIAEDPECPGIWAISNVAVLPEHRGRGIAGRLTDTAIAYVRRQRGRRILLQVRADNQAAQALYRHRGFIGYDVVHELDLPKVAWPRSGGTLPVPLRNVRAGDRRGLYSLVAATTPGIALGYPILRHHFRRGLWWRLNQRLERALGGPQHLELVGEREGEIVAYGRMSAQPAEASYEMGMNVAFDERSEWERPLIEGLIGMAKSLPRRRLRASVSSSHPEALHALRASGFGLVRTLTGMSLDLA